MREIETDYLVVGAGASGMAFVDALIAGSDDAEVVMVDRRHAPGGHWLDAYPFVRLHQPSTNYGVNSRPLGEDRIDRTGLNAGLYERATGPEVCAYFARVLDQDLLPTGRVRFLAMSDYRGADGDGHRVVSLVTGNETIVRVRRRLVDATYMESTIPSRHTPSFTVDGGVRMIPPNDLVDLGESPAGFTIVGAGKTAMDTCNWLLEEGVDPDRIQWFRPREAWLFNRAAVQPLDQVGSYMQMQASYVAAAAQAEDGNDFDRRLEADGVMVRIDPDGVPEVFRGATLSPAELELLRRIERVVRGRRVRHIGTNHVVTDQGNVAADPNSVYVDCTAAGVKHTIAHTVFEPDRITLGHVTLGIVPWSTATIGTVEARGGDDADKNRLCPTWSFTGLARDLRPSYQGMLGVMARSADPDISAWNNSSRLNPARAVSEHLDDPRVTAAFESMGSNFAAAVANLERLAAAPV